MVVADSKLWSWSRTIGRPGQCLAPKGADAEVCRRHGIGPIRPSWSAFVLPTVAEGRGGSTGP
jgi:hypothetical protein